MSAQNNIVLSIQDLSFKYPIKTVLEKINLDISKDDFLVILGSNGSGKSTLTKCINNEVSYSGRIVFNGLNLRENLKLQKRIGIVYQNPDSNIFPKLTIYENYLLRSKIFDEKPKSKVEFAEFIKRFNSNLNIRLDSLASDLSGGEKQCLALGLNVIFNPLLLILDEHTSALDPITSDNIIKLTIEIKETYGIPIIMTTHNLDYGIRTATKILLLKNGIGSVQNKPTDGYKKEELIELYI